MIYFFRIYMLGGSFIVLFSPFHLLRNNILGWYFEKIYIFWWFKFIILEVEHDMYLDLETSLRPWFTQIFILRVQKLKINIKRYRIIVITPQNIVPEEMKVTFEANVWSILPWNDNAISFSFLHFISFLV